MPCLSASSNGQRTGGSGKSEHHDDPTAHAQDTGSHRASCPLVDTHLPQDRLSVSLCGEAWLTLSRELEEADGPHSKDEAAETRQGPTIHTQSH